MNKLSTSYDSFGTLSYIIVYLSFNIGFRYILYFFDLILFIYSKIILGLLSD